MVRLDAAFQLHDLLPSRQVDAPLHTYTVVCQWYKQTCCCWGNAAASQLESSVSVRCSQCCV